MCGIVGLVSHAPSAIPAGEVQRRLRTMLPAIAHRGPDGEGTWLDDEVGVALGHRRLAIVDLSETGAQPMTSHDGRWVVSFNGEVYGYRQLRAELEGAGVRFRGSSDTEVLVEAIARSGVPATLERLNAMYALAVWDRERRELWLARDPAGEKPLYVWEQPDGVAFSSDLPALQVLPGFHTEVDPVARAAYLQLSYVPAPMSILRGVRKLEPGEWRRYDSTGVHTGTTQLALPDLPDGPNALLEVLTDAVSLRTVADVPVGVFLSGGIDSTVIAALAARAGTTHTFTAAFDVASHDESRHAARVAEALGTVHEPLPVSAADGLAVARRLPRMYGEPFGDPSAIPTHLIAAAARERVGVALTGDAGDELFGGYNRLVVGARLDRWRRRLPRPVRSLAGGLASRVEPSTVDRWGTAAAGVLRRPPVPSLGEKVHKAAVVLRAGGSRDAVAALVSIWDQPGEVTGDELRYPLALSGAGFADSLLSFDRRLTLPEQMLTKVDRATMAVGLEARPPLLDPRVVALATRAPLERHLHGGQGKQLLRALVPQLIEPALLDRPKMGFDPPIGAWLRGPLRTWANDLLSPDALRASGLVRTDVVRRCWRRHQEGASSEEQRLWTLLQYQLWWSTSVASAPAPAVAASS